MNIARNSIFFLALFPAFVHASTMGTSTAESEKKPSLLQEIRARTRLRAFSEVMSPSLRSTEGQALSVPGPDGKEVDPPNMFNIIQADFEFMKDSRFLVFQRMSNNLSAAAGLTGGDFNLRDPRLGWRQTNVIKAPGFVNSTIDFYTQLPLTDKSQSVDRILDLGIQASIAYSVPKSKFTVGVITDLRGSFFSVDSGQTNAQGFAAPWVSYDLSKKFSTQHWFNIPWQHKQGQSAGSISWNYPGGPYMQNGIGYSANKFLWFSLMLNNYMDTAPTLRNTWASLWVSVTAL